MVKSEVSHAVLEEDSRVKKSKKILTICSEFKNIKKCDILDIGTGSGHIIQEIAKQCKSATSIDLNDERMVKSGYVFKKVSDERLPFNNGSFDIAISNYVIEHVPNQRLHLNEIYRVLRLGGILYLALPDKYATLIDQHHKLPFITWLPRRLSNQYLQLVKKRKWDIYPISRIKLKQWIRGKFKLVDMTPKLMKYPDKYFLNGMSPTLRIIRVMPMSLLRVLARLIPTNILILKKINGPGVLSYKKED